MHSITKPNGKTVSLYTSFYINKYETQWLYYDFFMKRKHFFQETVVLIHKSTALYVLTLANGLSIESYVSHLIN